MENFEKLYTCLFDFSGCFVALIVWLCFDKLIWKGRFSGCLSNCTSAICQVHSFKLKPLIKLLHKQALANGISSLCTCCLYSLTSSLKTTVATNVIKGCARIVLCCVHLQKATELCKLRVQWLLYYSNTRWHTQFSGLRSAQAESNYSTFTTSIPQF